MTAATQRALARVAAGEGKRASALAEGIAASTLFRALALHGATGTRTLIVGAGALGRELASWLRRLNQEGAVFFLDDAHGTDGAAGRDIVGPVDIGAIAGGDRVLVAVANPEGRAAVVERLGGSYTGAPSTFPPYVDPTAVVGQATIGDGTLLLPLSLLSDRCAVGRFVIVNTHCAIGHDVTIGDFCTLSTGVCLTGRVTVGRGVQFGVGAKVLPGVAIGDRAIVGAGAVVVRDVPPGATVFGNPAKVIS